MRRRMSTYLPDNDRQISRSEIVVRVGLTVWANSFVTVLKRKLLSVSRLFWFPDCGPIRTAATIVQSVSVWLHPRTTVAVSWSFSISHFAGHLEGPLNEWASNQCYIMIFSQRGRKFSRSWSSWIIQSLWVPSKSQTMMCFPSKFLSQNFWLAHCQMPREFVSLQTEFVMNSAWNVVGNRPKFLI